MHTDVVIVGAGISGLSTALECMSHGYRCVLLERNDHCGGRIHTFFGNKNQWKYEAGAGRVNKKHHRTITLLKKFGMTLVEIPSKKEYRDIHDYRKRHTNPSSGLLEKVLDRSTQYSKHMLQNMTFGALCKQALGESSAQVLIDSFGYNAEFELMNAWDGLEVFKRDFSHNSKYYSCKEGLGVWIDRIRSNIEISQMVSILLGFTAYKWRKGPHGSIMVYAKCSKGKEYEMSCKALVFAIPKTDLLQSFSWSADQKRLLNSVQEVSLHRIYGQFPTNHNTSWFHSLPATTTNGQLRQFIPISQENGLAMLSYSDSHNADYWEHCVSDRGDRALRTSLLQQLHVVFPEIENIPKPLWVRSHYWNAGVHVWKPGYDSKKISHQLLQPFGEQMPIFMVGESYSMHQSWIEGALETVELATPRIHEYLQKHWYKSAF